MSRANEGANSAVAIWNFVMFPPWELGKPELRYMEPSSPKQSSPRIASGLSENLIRQIGGDRDAKLFALVRLHHEQYPEDEAQQRDETE
jgi:hypothetical protein